ncbi:MAG TPA: hypothetical protein VK874_10220 [Gaiellaceae bacterium]|nr:hypothetical protein [Gaiellaceae bacterium]
MDVEVAPDAEPDERRAIAEALEADPLPREPEGYSSPWWRAGLDGADGLPAPQATARRRKSAGALRA